MPRTKPAPAPTGVSDMSASFDGWFGAVDLEPGSYTALVRNPADGRTAEIALEVQPGLVASGP